MSFINLYNNYIWSETDIIHRTEAIIREQCSREQEDILTRKVTGQLVGVYTLTPEEQLEMQNYSALCEYARQEGVIARADNSLLEETIKLEKAQLRLDKPLVEELLDENNNIINKEEIDLDIYERELAQGVINISSQDAINLSEKRKQGEII